MTRPCPAIWASWTPAAFALVRDNNVPIIVCRMLGGDIRRAILGEQVGAIVHDC